MDQSLQKNKNSFKADLEEEDIIAQLSNEIIFKIFQYLNAESLLSCACVCKRWELIVNNNSFWKKYHKQFIKGLRAYGTYKGLTENEKSEKILKDEIFSEFQKQKNTLVFLYTRKLFGPSLLNSDIGALSTKFQISILFNKGEERTITTDHCIDSSCVVIHGIPEESVDIENIADVKVVASSQILEGISEEGRSQESICQKSLIFKEKIGSNIIKRYDIVPVNARNDKIDAFFTKSGDLFIGLWKDSSNLAFVYLCLHGDLLVEKCLLSNLQRIYSPPSGELTAIETSDVCDITCRLSNASLDLKFHETFHGRFSYIHSFFTYKSSERLVFDNLPDRPNFNWEAKSEKGLLKNLSVFTIIIKRNFSKVIWSGSSFVKLEEFFKHGGCGLKLFYQSDVGKVEIVFISEIDRFGAKVYKIHDVSMSFNLRKMCVILKEDC